MCLGEGEGEGTGMLQRGRGERGEGGGERGEGETERAWGEKRVGKGMGMLRREKELGSSSSGVLSGGLRGGFNRIFITFLGVSFQGHSLHWLVGARAASR